MKQVVSLDALRSAESVPESLRCPLCRKLMEEAVLVLACDKVGELGRGMIGLDE
jgi:hypothetical protein